jgi:hypothetical protein
LRAAIARAAVFRVDDAGFAPAKDADVRFIG